MRTYGTYRFEKARTAPYGGTIGTHKGQWILTLEPSVRLRARRILGRVQQTRSMDVTIEHTAEVCHDLAWFMTRFPLEAADPESERLLFEADASFQVRQDEVDLIVAGGGTKLDLPQEPAKEAREYQKLAVQLLRARLRLLLTDEVGLGKTFTGLLNLVHDDALPAVVVAPTHLPPRWVTELEEAFPWLTYEVAKSTKVPARLAVELPDVLILSYSKLDGWGGFLQGRAKSVIFDEVQELRHGAGTLKGAAAAMIADEATFVMGLTATPVYNYGGEIWNIMDILAKGELGTREEFSREWAPSNASNGQAIVSNPYALGSYLRESGLMLGRTRKEVGRELPKTIKVPYLIDIDKTELLKVEANVKRLAELILSDTASQQEKFQAAGEVDWQLRQATGVGKAPFVAEFVRMLLESEEKIVLFGWHRAVYDIWMEKLAEFNPKLYTGSESPKQKAEVESEFKLPRNPDDPDDCRILIMSLRSGAGVDGLQKVARVAVFGELDWSPAVHEQAIGRLRRDGMGNEPPVAYFLNTTEGSDPAVMERLQIKRQQGEPLITSDGKLFQNATTDQSKARALAQSILGIEETSAE